MRKCSDDNKEGKIDDYKCQPANRYTNILFGVVFNRLKDGFVYVRNPMNIHQISKIPLSPDVVDGIVF